MTWKSSVRRNPRLVGKKFKATVEPPYRWRDWAAKSDGITSDVLKQLQTETTAELEALPQSSVPKP
jgi:type I restriction enzyme M protein